MATLHQLVLAHDVPAVKTMLASGVDPNALDERGQPALSYVLGGIGGAGFVFEKPAREILKALLEAGADPKVAGAGKAVIEDADRMVCSAGEAGEAHDLARMLGGR